MHIGANMEVVTAVGAKYAKAPFGCMLPCGYGSRVSYSEPYI